MEKSLEIAWVGPQVGWGRVSGNQQSGANSVTQVDGDLDMTPMCQICGRRAQKRNNGLCQHFYLGENSLFSSHPEGKQFRFSPYVSMALVPFKLLPNTGPQRGESKSCMAL